MVDYTYIEILVEDKSGSVLIEHIMEKYASDNRKIGYKINSYITQSENRKIHSTDRHFTDTEKMSVLYCKKTVHMTV